MPLNKAIITNFKSGSYKATRIKKNIELTTQTGAVIYKSMYITIRIILEKYD